MINWKSLFPSSLIIKRKDLWKFIFFTSHLEIGFLFVYAINLHFTSLIVLITDLTIVSFQIYDIVKTYGRVNVNHISINCCEQMTTCTEGALKKEAGDYENQLYIIWKLCRKQYLIILYPFDWQIELFFQCPPTSNFVQKAKLCRGISKNVFRVLIKPVKEMTLTFWHIKYSIYFSIPQVLSK